MKRSANKQDLFRVKTDNPVDSSKKITEKKLAKPLSKEITSVLSKKPNKSIDVKTNITFESTNKLQSTTNKTKSTGKQEKIIKIEVQETVLEKTKRKRWSIPDVWPNGSKITCMVNEISIEAGRIIRDSSKWKALILENKVYYDLGTADRWVNALALLPENEHQDQVKVVKKKKAPR